MNSQFSGSRMTKNIRALSSFMDEGISSKVNNANRQSGSSSGQMTYPNNQNSAAINSELNQSPEKLVTIDNHKQCHTKKMLKESDKSVPKRRRPRYHQRKMQTLQNLPI